MISDKNILELSYDEELEAVIMVWNGFSSSSEFRQGNEDVLHLLKIKRASKIIADCRNMRIISIADQQWLYLNWIPRAIKSGLRSAAIVESEDFFNRMSVDNVSQQVNDQLSIQYFTNLFTARSWLRRT